MFVLADLVRLRAIVVALVALAVWLGSHLSPAAEVDAFEPLRLRDGISIKADSANRWSDGKYGTRDMAVRLPVAE